LNMGKVLGIPAYVTGKIRDKNWIITDFDPENSEQQNRLRGCFISDSASLLSDSGEKLGSITICSSDRSVVQELQKSIRETVVSAASISLLLILLLFFIIRRIVLLPVASIVNVLGKNADVDVPLEKVPASGADEIRTLATTINGMIDTVHQREDEINSALITVQESERRYRASVENAADAFFLIDRDGCFKDVNYLACASLGYTRDALLTMKLPDIEIAFSLEKLAGLFKSMQSGEMKTLTGNHLRKDGSTFPVEVRVSLNELDGEQFVLAYARDVSERKQAEDILRESEARFKGLAQQVPVPLAYVTKTGEIEFLNSRFTSTFGYTLEDMPTIDHWWPLAYPDESYRAWVIETWDEACQQAIDKQQDIEAHEYQVRCKNGDVKTVEISGVFLGDDLLATLVDMTERIESEANIRKLSLAVEQSGEAIMITDLQGSIEYINPSFTEMTGYAEDEALGQKPNLLKSGNQSTSFYQSMWDRLVAGEVWHGKVINRKKSGDFYPAMLTISPIKNEQGVTTNYIALQQNLEEMEALEAQFHQSQKMEAIGTLVGGIAHDFNNNLAGMTGNLYLAKKAAKDMPEIGKRLENVEKLAFGAAATIQQLLAFSRKGVVEMHPLSISSFLKETVKLSEISLPENIAFKLDVHDPDMKINGDITQLQQVLMNLINNAHDAVEDSREPYIAISLHRFHADKQFIAMHEGMNEGDYACIEVSDNGCGMGDENIKHIFEPFFTTKELGKGTGLGLAMVYGAVKTHGGVIDVQSSQGEDSGTTMRIYLPLIESADIASDNGTIDEVISGHGETILLVDDNQTVLETGRDVLEGLNYQVLTAEDGESAIERYKTHMSEIDLIILDVVMPKLGGVEALQAIRDFNPDVKAMFATGYDKLSTLAAIDQEFRERVISKPFAISRLSQMIREVLED